MSGKHNIKADYGAAGEKVIEIDLPSNSYKSREVKTEVVAEKKIGKITTGNVKTKKKGFGKKFAEVFIGDDVTSVSSYILYDVLIPAAKSTLSDMVSGGIEMLLFGEAKGTRTRRDKNKSYVSYSSYSRGERERGASDRSAVNRARHNFDEIILESRGEAEEVLSHLVDLTEDYGQATIADLYSLVGMTSAFTDDKYGWTNLSTATVSRVREGYLINLPKAILVD